jgi:hypothetical protein
MSSDDRDSLIPPFLENALTEMHRLGQLRRLLAFGCALGAQLSTVIQQLTSAYRIASLSDLLAPLKEQSDGVREFAESQLNGGFTIPGGLLVVRFVTIIETAVSEAVVWSFRTRPAVLERPEVRRLKGSLADFARASEEQRAELLANLLARDLGASLKVGIGKYETLLEIVGLGGHVNPAAREIILELIEVRNVVVHGGGRVDERFRERCPFLNLSVGDAVQFTARTLDRYHAAVSYYVMELAARWAETDGHMIRTEPFFAGPMAEAQSVMQSPEGTR